MLKIGGAVKPSRETSAPRCLQCAMKYVCAIGRCDEEDEEGTKSSREAAIS